MDVRFWGAVLAGILLAGAYPPLGISGLAWVAPAAILFAASTVPPRRAFVLGGVSGLVFFLASLYWLLLIPYRFHGVPIGPAAGWLALAIYLACFPALWVWLSWRGFDLIVGRGANRFDALVQSSFGRRLAWTLFCAALWVALEMARSRFLSGFPWNILGSTQYRLWPLLQVASVTGIYGVSFLLVWFSIGLGSALALLINRPRNDRRALLEIFPAGTVVAVLCWWGFQRAPAPVPEGETDVRFGLVQPSIPQTLIWDPNENSTRFRRLIEVTRETLTNRVDVLVWPEAALPEFDEANFQKLLDLTTRNNAWFILGADDVERDDSAGIYRFYNSSFLFDPRGRAVERYHKRRLVIFGEYIPLVRWLPFLKWVTPIGSGFTAGKEPVQFETKNPDLKIGVLICFEDVFPHYAREHVEEGTDLLLNQTNDGWFGEGAAHWQQAAGALFRAIENGVPLIRCTNNGLTCWIDRYGRIRQYFSTPDRGIYGPGHMIAAIPQADLGGQPTFYRNYGDVFGWGCVAAAALVVMGTISRKRASSKTQIEPLRHEGTKH